MTTNDVWNRLVHIDSEIQGLFSDTGFCYDDSFSFVPCPNDRESRFLNSSMEGASRFLQKFHEQMDYLRMPAQEPHTLHRTEFKRYGYQDGDGSLSEFHCGQTLEALVPDYDGSLKWVLTRVEHNGSDYYLVGYSSTPMEGLTVRRRRRP